MSQKTYFNFHSSLWIGAVTFAVFFYYLGTEFVAPSRNVLKIFWGYLNPPTYTFYSGNKEGNYHEIGKELVRANSSIDIVNINTPGAIENLLEISSNPNSIGIVQEDTIESSLVDINVTNRSFRLVSPLYTEKIHILYWPIDILVQENPSLWDVENNINLELNSHSLRLELQKKTINIDDYLKEATAEQQIERASQDASFYLSHPIINLNLGVMNSGSYLMSHALLTQAGVIGFEERETQLEFDEAMQKFQTKELHAIFFLTGAPLNSINLVLNRGAKLMNIQGIELIRDLNEDFGFILRPDRFKEDYSRQSHVSTLGTQALLMASTDVPNQTLLEMLENFQKHLNEIEQSGENTPLKPDELNASIDIVRALAQQDYNELIRDFLLFCVMVVVGTIAALNFLSHFISSLKKKGYFDKIFQISYNVEEIESNSEIDLFDKIKLISNLIQKLIGLKKNILADYQTGGITDECLSFLHEKIDDIIDLASNLMQSFFIQLKYRSSKPYTKNHDEILDRFLSGNINGQTAIELMEYKNNK